jgi:N-acetylneuraminic acid mutarotase
MTPLPIAGLRPARSLKAVLDGRVLVSGGLSSAGAGAYLATAELYDSVTNNWAVVAQMPSGHSGHGAVLLPEGDVLAVGGRDENGAVPRAQRYITAGNRWAPAGALTEARWLHTITPLPGGQVIVIGGQQADDDAIASIERYDPHTNSWTGRR